MRAKTKLKEPHLVAGGTGRPPRGPGTFRRGLSSSCVISYRSRRTGAGMTTTIKRRRGIDGRGKLDVGDRGRALFTALRRTLLVFDDKLLWLWCCCLVFLCRCGFVFGFSFFLAF